ncbi:TonB-dependent receptor [Massilia sp. UMI-21]|nr:TonB-dependent receptor [Massilia sp. UMI-21]
MAGAGKGQDLFFYRRTIEVPRETTNNSRTLHVDATLEGSFELRSMPWNWSLGNWSATWGMRYLSPVLDQCLNIPRGWECNAPQTIRAGFTSAGANRLPSLTYHDISVGYKFAWNGALLAGVNNVFDKAPRFTLLGASSATTIDADLPIDRFFYVRYTQNF